MPLFAQSDTITSEQCRQAIQDKADEEGITLHESVRNLMQPLGVSILLTPRRSNRFCLGDEKVD